MKIKMLGTGAVYTKYNSATTLVDECILVDTPNGGLKQFLKNDNDISKLHTILITHMHGDHIADLLFFLTYIVRYVNTNEPINVIGPIGIKEKLRDFERVYEFKEEYYIEKKYNMKIIEIASGIIEVNNYKIQAFEVEHNSTKMCLGYVINDTLGLTGDTTLCEAVEDIFISSKLVVSDCSFLKTTNTHMGVDSVGYLIEKYNKKVIPTHLRDETREYLKENKINNLYLLNDFDDFSI